MARTVSNEPVSITVLCANMASNALGRAYMLARILQRRHRVHIVGASFGGPVWPPADTGLVPMTVLRGGPLPGFARTLSRLASLATGDALYAVKPRLSSFGAGLLARRRTGAPLALDIDDWDAEGDYGLRRPVRLVRAMARLGNPYAPAWLSLMTRFIPRADAITTVSRSLQARFGGRIVPHARDTEALDPAKVDRSAARAALGLSGETVVMFLGTLRPHKGVDDIAAAVARTSVDALLVIVGAEPADPQAARLTGIADGRLRVHGPVAFEDVPRLLAAADIVALAQRDVAFARAQVPAKVFDAMAMARALIVTSVGDLPEIVGDGALVVSPGDVAALTAAIERLATDRALAAELGARARARCIARYSWNAVEPVLADLFAGLLANGRAGLAAARPRH